MADPTVNPFIVNQPQQTNLLKRAHAWIQHAEKSPAAKMLTYVAGLPAESVNAILGAPQRVNASHIANLRSNPRGVLEASIPFNTPLQLLDPAGRKQLGNDVYAATHPNDMSVELAAERAAGVNHLMTTDPRFRGKLQNFAVRTGFETATDPLTPVGGTAALGERTLGRMGEATTRALTSSNPLVRGTAKTLATNVEERIGGFTPKDIAALNTVRQRGITQSRMQHTADEALLHSESGNLSRGIVSPRMRQRLLQEPYVNGTPEMREQAVAFGYKPTAAEKAKPPTGAIDYNLRENYDPHTGVMKAPGQFNDLLVGEEEKLREPVAGMEMPQKPGTVLPPESLPDRMNRRLAQGRAVVRHRTTAQGLQEHLGVGPEMANSMATESRIGGLAPAQAISKAQVDAMLATGAPHIKNVGVLGFNVMGEPGIARAMYLTAKPDKALLGRLEQGGSSHFGVRTPGKLSPARLVPPLVRKATTGLLDKWDQALRSARLEQIDKTHPGMSEMEKLNMVNQDLGAYNLKPQYVKLLQSVGANFPQWHNYVVPTAVGRAVIKYPGNVERLARYEQNANDAFLPNAKYRVTLGGPNDEFASLMSTPANLAIGKGAKYFLSPSSIGPASMLLPTRISNVPWDTRVLEAASQFVPFGDPALAAIGNTYKSPLPPLGRLGTGLAGVYTQKRPPESMARTRPTSPTAANPFILPGASPP